MTEVLVGNRRLGEDMTYKAKGSTESPAAPSLPHCPPLIDRVTLSGSDVLPVSSEEFELLCTFDNPL